MLGNMNLFLRKLERCFLISLVGISLASCGILYDIDIEGDPMSGPAPLTVQFTSDTDGYVGIIEYDWDFGDGNSSASDDPSHIFTEAGVYTVTCVANNGENSVSTSIEIEVTEP